jgi:sterol desaturase/sphingolipid hydroxylase (fatty acid hydroxylase superfamily)
MQVAQWAEMPLLAAVIFIPLERLWPWRRQQVLRAGWTTDLAYVLVNGLFIWVGMSAVLVVAMAAQRLWTPTGITALVSRQPLWLQTIAALLVGDFCLYWAHRALHRSPFLWRFHSIHHAVEELDWAAAYHSHPIDAVILKGAAVLPIIVLGFSPIAIGIYMMIYGWVSLVVHSNIRVTAGPLRWFVSSSAFHRWHHSNEPEARDRNFASIVSLWDFMFRTAFLPVRRMPKVYGIDGGMPLAYADQLLNPFRVRRRTAGLEPPGMDGMAKPAT